MHDKWMRILSVSVLSVPLVLSASAASAQSYELIEAAREEGQLNTIALPHDWCGYGDVIALFKEKYGIEVNETRPEASSAEQLEAIRNTAENDADAPDVIDIGFSFAPVAQQEGLLAAFKVGTWDTIPDDMKDPEGFWIADYYGVIAFAVNTDKVNTLPVNWQALLSEEYKGMVALSGDPRRSAQAARSVFAAGLSTEAVGGEAVGAAGLQFFADLNAAGNFIPQSGTRDSLIDGTTPIVIGWDYAALADRDSVEEGGPKIEVIVPENGVVARPFVQAISVNAPHPNAAKLWMEFLYSDDGQRTWLAGGCHPIRFPDLVKYDKVPASFAEKLPPAEAYQNVVFPSLEDLGLANRVIADQWDETVGAEIN